MMRTIQKNLALEGSETKDMSVKLYRHAKSFSHQASVTMRKDIEKQI